MAAQDVDALAGKRVVFLWSAAPASWRRAMSAMLKCLSANAGSRSGNEGVVARLRHQTAYHSSRESFPSFENYGYRPAANCAPVTSPAECRTDARKDYG